MISHSSEPKQVRLERHSGRIFKIGRTFDRVCDLGNIQEFGTAASNLVANNELGTLENHPFPPSLLPTPQETEIYIIRHKPTKSTRVKSTGAHKVRFIGATLTRSADPHSPALDLTGIVDPKYMAMVVTRNRVGGKVSFYAAPQNGSKIHKHLETYSVTPEGKLIKTNTEARKW